MPFPVPQERGISSGASLCSILGSDFQYVKEYHQRPVEGPPFAAVGSHQLVHIVHPSFCGIIIHDDLWFLMLLATDFPIPVQCTHQYHILTFLWHIRYQGHVSSVHKLGRLDRPVVSSWGGSSGLFFRIVPTMVSFFFRSSCPSLCEVKKLSHVMLCPLSP